MNLYLYLVQIPYLQSSVFFIGSKQSLTLFVWFVQEKKKASNVLSFTASLICLLAYLLPLVDFDEEYSGSLNLHELKEMLALVQLYCY